MFSIRQNFTQRSSRLPKKNQLLTMDTVYKAQPFVQIVAKNENTYGLDVIRNAQPVIAAFNNRLTGPIISVSSNHADVQNWLNTVSWNGGSASSTTITALNTFCAAIDNAGIRNKFYRLNLFCGNNLQSCLVPLYISPSTPTIGGLQNTYGYVSDINFNFTSSDYNETGVSGGLQGSTSLTKRLRTGLAQNILPFGDLHLSAYNIMKSNAASDCDVGARNNSTSQYSELLMASGPTDYGFSNFSITFSRASDTNYSQSGAMMLGVASGTLQTLYKNGSQVSTATASAVASTSSQYSIFATENETTTAADYTNARLGGYSIGLSMNSIQVTAYYNAIQAFQISLTRNV